MGKLIQFVAILVFIDILFIITGQNVLNSPSSAIINALLDPANIQASQLWILIITGGVATLAIVGSVVLGIVTRNVEFFFFVTFALGFATLVGDFVAIFLYLASFNVLIATITIGPLMILFLMTVLEWLRGKD